MDTVAAFAPRRSDVHATVGVAVAPDSQKALAVAAVYRLSEEGRKASLLAGGDGRAVQQRTVDVPVNRLHLVSVDFDGVAHLKLRPRYEIDSSQSVLRIDDIPTYDAPPSVDDLFKDAARNHQLEQKYEAERRAAKARSREAAYERRDKIAQAFLSDPTQRALVHPTPTRERCYLDAGNGRHIPFDARIGTGAAREVPAEAHRRFRSDLRVRRERGLCETTDCQGAQSGSLDPVDPTNHVSSFPAMGMLKETSPGRPLAGGLNKSSASKAGPARPRAAESVK